MSIPWLAIAWPRPLGTMPPLNCCWPSSLGRLDGDPPCSPSGGVVGRCPFTPMSEPSRCICWCCAACCDCCCAIFICAICAGVLDHINGCDCGHNICHSHALGHLVSSSIHHVIPHHLGSHDSHLLWVVGHHTITGQFRILNVFSLSLLALLHVSIDSCVSKCCHTCV